MNLQEQIEEFNKRPNAKYAYIGLIIAVLFTIAAIADPQATIGMFFSIISLLFYLLVCYFIFKFCFRSQKQQQQQQVVINNSNKKARVCPKCGLQNDIDSKFCSDCGYEFKIGKSE
ncbi:MAG: zinc-ribbon domain-containing protein [Methanosarcina flavescens]|jgi:amino acid permease|uniref:Zinc-ribbon domain-containing protein n=1 Tax=Methanosarcina flavescens TaxID=1715806 RepID=A0A660HUZ9_9EURY|nr:zinc-ribbon domain-containing protein [Methanosarcina flavescens]AYK16168.1 zinc-ribbon domain-containing protein [Methanosarcina flavescens]NLK31731.1 zinc-ribbon domain-containing protein [Methanosarcina flavescens]